MGLRPSAMGSGAEVVGCAEMIDTNCACGAPTVFTADGHIMCANTAAKCIALGVMPESWLPLSMERPHPPTRHCMCPDCKPSFED